MLCYFEGLTLDEAARRLRCPAGTLRSRLLQSAREAVISLTRGGIGLPGTALGALLTPQLASSVPPLLRDTTARAAIHFTAHRAAGGALSAPAVELARDVLRTMLLSKLKLGVVSFLLLVSAATGATLAMMSDEPKGGSMPVAKVSPREADPPTPVATPDGAAPGRMLVTGSVFDTQGKPAPNTAVMVYAQPKDFATNDFPLIADPSVLGQGRCDESGRFRIDVVRTGSSRYRSLGVTALAPGYGLAWVALDSDADEPRADLVLSPTQVIHGRVLDLQGRPVQAAELRIRGILRSADRQTERLLFRGPLEERTDAWPAPVGTDADGRFILRGVGRANWAVLVIDDPRFALQNIIVETEGAVGGAPFGQRATLFKAGGTSDSKPLTMVLQPARIVTGRVTAADSGEHVRDAHILTALLRNAGSPTDADGRFRARVATGDRFALTIIPPQGQPYLGVTKQLDWPKGAVEHSIDITLPRGVVIHGKVTEAGSGASIAEAAVRLLPHQVRTTTPQDGSMPVSTKSDGSFQLVTEPGPGHLVVEGPSDDYVLKEFATQMFPGREPAGFRAYAHAVVACDIKLGSERQEVNVVLRRGVTVQGRAVGVDGQPVQDAWMLSRTVLSGAFLRRWFAEARGGVHDGRFALYGLDPDAEVPVYFLDAKGKRGATLSVSGKLSEKGPVTVRLEPCGAAKARLLDSTGKPVTQCRLHPYSIVMVVTPGAAFGATKRNPEQLFADEDILSRIDPINYGKPIESDSEGRVALPVLIPGATYRFVDRTTTIQGQAAPQLRKEFIVKPGETLDLGEVLIQEPR